MALTSIVGEDGDPLSVILLTQGAGSVTGVLGDSLQDGELLVGTVAQGFPSNITDEGDSVVMTLLPVSAGASIFGSNIISPMWGG